MSLQGVFGVFPFTVSEEEFASFRNLQREREIAFAEHKVVSGLPKLQHVGRELDTVSLQVVIHPVLAKGATIGVDARILALRLLARTGQELPLVLGLSYFGLYVLKNVDVEHTIFHNGRTWSAHINLKLQEYN